LRSGHVAALVNPPGNPQARATASPDDGVNPPAAEDWLNGASERSETWWTDWAAWLGERSGELKRAPKRAGNRRHAVLGPAPGTYVLED
jgi:poly(3-hydroxyalkanoate) synthetase